MKYIGMPRSIALQSYPYKMAKNVILGLLHQNNKMEKDTLRLFQKSKIPYTKKIVKHIQVIKILL